MISVLGIGVLMLLCLALIVKHEVFMRADWPLPPVVMGPLLYLMGGIGAPLLGFMLVITARWLFDPTAGISLRPDGVQSLGGFTHYEIPWDELLEIGRLEVAMSHGKPVPYIGLRVRDVSRIPMGQLTRTNTVANPAHGFHFLINERAFPLPGEAFLRSFYHGHPDERAALGTEAGLARLQAVLAGAQDDPTEECDLPDGIGMPGPMGHLLDADLRQAIEARIAADTPETRRALYQQLLAATCWFPTEGESSAISGTRDEEGRTYLLACTDPMALARVEPHAKSLLALTAGKLCEAALAHRFDGIVINPAGPVGGALTRAEIEALARGQLPE